MKPWTPERRASHAVSVKRWEVKNPAARREIRRRYYLRHREQLIEKARAYIRAHREERRERARKWRAEHRTESRAIVRKSDMKRTFRMTIAEYDARVTAQHNRCAICGDPPTQRRLAIDHDHATGVVRDLLCWQCNTMLGKSRDSIAILERAIAYLRRHAPRTGVTP